MTLLLSMSESDSIVTLSNVSKTFRQLQASESVGPMGLLQRLFKPRYRQVRALQHINLDIKRGEMVAYAGPNGAGKSTTVKLLSAMLTPDEGSVRVLGMDPVQDRVRYVRRIGVVFGQRSELWMDQPISASFEWKRVVWDVPRARYEYMTAQLKELLGLTPFFNSVTRELSLGQKMRADLALALIHEPEILFLDEPTLGLDVLAKRNVLDFIKQINRTQRVTVMLTSHDMSDLEALAERVVMVDQGRIAFDGNWDRLRREFSDQRLLSIETPTEQAPILTSAHHTHSEGNRHTYRFDATHINITALLEQATAQTAVLDVETHRAPIDDIIADIYTRWQAAPTPTPQPKSVSSSSS